MRKVLLALLAVATLALFGANQALAAPTFCYNKNTGAFAHWGKCRVVCNYYGPGGQCRKVTW
jgi:hypothetical protein